MRPRRSRLRAVDVVAESWLEATRRPGRSLVSALGVTVGVAAIVATLTLVETIRFQVSDEFDALRASQVELRPADDRDDERAEGFPPPDALGRLDALRGVVGAAAVRTTRDGAPLALHDVDDPTATQPTVPVHAVSIGALEALDLEVRGPGWARWHEEEAERVALVTASALEELGAADIAIGDRVHVGGAGFTVAGVVEDSPRLPSLAAGVLVPISVADLLAVDPDRDRIVVVVAPGAADQVAAAAPAATAPVAPEEWTAYAPVDDERLRHSVDAQLETLALALGGVVLLLGLISIGNVTLSSVLQRIPEIGLRRALGARARHIAAHVLVDAVVLAALGGVAGAALGLTATLAVTAAQGWQPVVDPAVPAGAIVASALAGLLAGAYPAWVGGRLEPTEALRRG